MAFVAKLKARMEGKEDHEEPHAGHPGRSTPPPLHHHLWRYCYTNPHNHVREGLQWTDVEHTNSCP
jgi:hypothetical protein